jgi:riboflavin biosynthesis pyrimidine reductase
VIATPSASGGLPTRARPRGVEPIETLVDLGPGRHADRRALTPELARLYDGELAIGLRPDRPTVVANFVETLDGVVALDRDGGSGGGEVSGFSPTDRLAMGLLRALADVVLVGAATVRASSRGRWTPDAVAPAHAEAFGRLRASLGLPPQPTTLIATGGGQLDPGHRAFADPGAPVVVAGPLAALDRLRPRLPGHVRFEPLARGPAGPEVVAIAERLGARLVLSEGGPRLIGRLVADRVLDELFLTLAPQLAGRDDRAERLGLIEGVALWPRSPRWLRLRSVRRAGDHLLLRYAFEEETR